MVHSTQQMGMPRMISEMKYGIMKTPPPLVAARPGNRRKLPSPTAEPATARMTPSREPQLSLAACRTKAGSDAAILVSGHHILLKMD